MSMPQPVAHEIKKILPKKVLTLALRRFLFEINIVIFFGPAPCE